MRRVVRFQSRARADILRNLVRIDFRRPGTDVLVAHQFIDAIVDKVRIAKVLGAIGEYAFFHFGNEMNVLRGIMRDICKEMLCVIFDLEELNQCETAGTWRWRRQHLVAAPVAA